MTEQRARATLEALGLTNVNEGAFCGRWIDCDGDRFDSMDPTTGEPIAFLDLAGRDYEGLTKAPKYWIEEDDDEKE